MLISKLEETNYAVTIKLLISLLNNKISVNYTVLVFDNRLISIMESFSEYFQRQICSFSPILWWILKNPEKQMPRPLSTGPCWMLAARTCPTQRARKARHTRHTVVTLDKLVWRVGTSWSSLATNWCGGDERLVTLHQHGLATLCARGGRVLACKQTALNMNN